MYRRIPAVLALTLLLGACGENEAPSILAVSELQNTVSTMGPYEVLATVTDDTKVELCSLMYDVDDGVAVEVVMDRLEGNVWRGVIPGHPVGTTVRYLIVAVDEDGDDTLYPLPGLPLLSFEIEAP